MSTFNTHGGFFSPQGYFKVNTGGSHDENPNGGVQIGVDPEGVPNMLEEGEPVYNDYVYSDIINADKEILKKHGIPEKFGDMLYSDIADKYVDEAEERPNDPISNNGLNAMLVRLAEAQEEQKQIQKQKELEEELSQMSPEELAELEAMLSQQEQPQEAMVSPEAQFALEQEMMQQPIDTQNAVDQVPMMKNGGFIKTFQDGGGKSGVRTGSHDDASTTERVMDAIAPGYLDIKEGNIGKGLRRAAEGYYDMFLSDGPGGVMAAPVVGPIRAARAGKRAAVVGEAMEEAYRAAEKTGPVRKVVDAVSEKVAPVVEKVRSSVGKAERVANSGKKVDMSGWGHMLYDPSFVARRVKGNPNLGWWGKTWRSGLGAVPALEWELPVAGKGIGVAADAIRARTTASSEEAYNRASSNDPFSGVKFANGGAMNMFFDGGMAAQARKMKKLGWADEDIASHLGIDIGDLPALLYSGSSGGAAGSAAVKNRNAAKQPELVKGVTVPEVDISDFRRAAEDAAERARWAYNDQSNAFSDEVQQAVDSIDIGNPEPIVRDDTKTKMLPTWMRYTGPVMNGLLALHNAVQKPDKYKIGRYHPIVPSTQMHLVDPVYIPMDTNIGINDLLANSGYTTYGLMQTSGPSAPQTLLAHDYGIGRGVGNVRAAYDDANTQRRNAVIAGINQNATALGNFHNAQNNVWANTFNDSRLRNINANLQEQQLNYASEAQKYAAIQSQLGSLAKALSDIGWENASRNMINGDEAWDYGYGYGFDPNYKATRKKNNGEGV